MLIVIQSLGGNFFRSNGQMTDLFPFSFSLLLISYVDISKTTIRFCGTIENVRHRKTIHNFIHSAFSTICSFSFKIKTEICKEVEGLKRENKICKKWTQKSTKKARSTVTFVFLFQFCSLFIHFLPLSLEHLAPLVWIKNDF